MRWLQIAVTTVLMGGVALLGYTQARQRVLKELLPLAKEQPLLAPVAPAPNPAAEDHGPPLEPAVAPPSGADAPSRASAGPPPVAAAPRPVIARSAPPTDSAAWAPPGAQSDITPEDQPSSPPPSETKDMADAARAVEQGLQPMPAPDQPAPDKVTRRLPEQAEPPVVSLPPEDQAPDTPSASAPPSPPAAEAPAPPDEQAQASADAPAPAAPAPPAPTGDQAVG